jgi:hypothetical protein
MHYFCFEEKRQKRNLPKSCHPACEQILFDRRFFFPVRPFAVPQRQQGDQIWPIFAYQATVNFGQFILIAEIVQICGLPFPIGKRCVFIFPKDGLAYILGDFFHRP